MAYLRPAWLVLAPGISLVMGSTGYVATKFGLGYIEPMTFLALRFACAVVIMAGLSVIPRAVDDAPVVVLLTGVFNKPDLKMLKPETHASKGSRPKWWHQRIGS